MKPYLAMKEISYEEFSGLCVEHDISRELIYLDHWLLAFRSYKQSIRNEV